jgi:ribosomal protein S18 acetylase RimI-like enzyme
MEISPALKTDIVPIMDLIRKAVRAMNDGGLFQWTEAYPNEEIITDDISTGTLYKITTDNVIAGGNIIAGIIVLNHQYFPEYNALKWDVNDPHPLIVHRLCIHPDYQGQGLARVLMQFAEAYAVRNHYLSIRLDTGALNTKALALYDALGYRRVGEVSFRPGIFQVFEKGM